jgi:hypothetical protein
MVSRGMLLSTQEYRTLRLSRVFHCARIKPVEPFTTGSVRLVDWPPILMAGSHDSRHDKEDSIGCGSLHISPKTLIAPMLPPLP